MNKRITDLIYQRKTLTGLLVFFSICLTPAIVFCLFSIEGIVSGFIVILEGFLFARILRSIGMFLLREPVEPWYARSYSLALLLILGPFVNILCLWADCLIFTVLPMSKDIPQWARMLALIPIEFLWIILLDWRSDGSEDDSKPKWMHIPQNQKFNS